MWAWDTWLECVALIQVEPEAKEVVTIFFSDIAGPHTNKENLASVTKQVQTQLLRSEFHVFVALLN